MDKAQWTPSQALAVDSLNAPMAVTAGAGSGKTSVLVARYLHLLHRGILPENILCLTFTNDAAREMKQRVMLGLKDLPQLAMKMERSAQLGTLHGFCYQTVNSFGSEIGLQPIQSILSDFQSAQIFDDAYGKWLDEVDPLDFEKLLTHYNHKEIRSVYQSLAKHLYGILRKGSLGSYQTLSYSITQLFIEVGRQMLESMAEKALQRGLYRFDEIEHYTLELLENSLKVREQLQNQYRALMVDEFQDTSPIQWDILKLLMGNDFHKLFFVGDPKQSIYRFRHAEMELFHHASALVQQHQGQVCQLGHNFRTHGKLLTQLNQISASLFKEMGIHEQMHQGHPHDDGVFSVHKVEGLPQKPRYYENELQTVVAEIEKDRERGIPTSEIAVLFRVTERIESFDTALRAKGICTQTGKSSKLFASLETHDLYWYFKLLANPMDQMALVHFYLSPHVQMELNHVVELHQTSKLYEHLWENPQLSWLAKLMESKVSHAYGCLKPLFRHSLSPHWNENLWQALLQEADFKHQSVIEFLQAMESWKEDDLFFQNKNSKNLGQGVSLLTVHASKGLEFEKVYLVDLLRTPPHPSPLVWWSKEEAPYLKYRKEGQLTETDEFLELKNSEYEKDEQESKRILYVALTRAKKELAITVPLNLKLIPKKSWASYLEPFMG